ncbi:hypothetical protein [Streptomyces sp. DT171]|uniref:hypothetical protein n=1 Tax=Streptomyces sp. DT171 TaxID=3416524 RepID=UPI003CFB22A7
MSTRTDRTNRMDLTGRAAAVDGPPSRRSVESERAVRICRSALERGAGTAERGPESNIFRGED